MKSSIIDVPRNHTQEDLFGVKIYQDALVKYIRHTETPITIALQGEWGSGKTSLMNLLRWHLCDEDNAPYYPIWINTWQYSLMKTPNQAIMSILEGIISQIAALNPKDSGWNESKKKIGKLFGKLAMTGTKIAAGVVGVDGETIDGVANVFSSDSPESDIVQLKKEISSLISKTLGQDSRRTGFTFYIDDLDRIDPPMAVEILELLKNIFDLEHCIFILAIDYDVVIKGLKPKFGELTDKNEREFRSFFDKIIQLPFSMPVASYSIDGFLVDALTKIEFFTPQELADAQLTESLSEIARLSVGSNPRSLKRLTNTLSLISIINADLMANNQADSRSKLINFALVCTQIAYPYVYNQLVEEPDYKSWNDSTASRLKLRRLTADELESLNATEEFDEDWEKIVFRMCQQDTYLSNRAFQVSGLLNKLLTIINNDAQLGEIVASIIQQSAVTNLKAFDTAPKLTKFNRDTSKYRFEGKEYDRKTELVRDVVQKYIDTHSGCTLEQIQEAFCIKKNMSTVFLGEALYNDYWENDQKKLGFFKDKDKLQDSDFLQASDCRFMITTNWPTTVSGKPAAFMQFIDVSKKLGLVITSF